MSNYRIPLAENEEHDAIDFIREVKHSCLYIEASIAWTNIRIEVSEEGLADVVEAYNHWFAVTLTEDLFKELYSVT